MWVIPFLLAFSVVVLFVWYYTLRPPVNSPPYVVVNTVQTANIDITQPLNTVDSIELGAKMTVALIGQDVDTQNGVYGWVAADQPLQLFMPFDNTITRLTSLSGAIFANAQLLYVGPNKVFSMLATQSIASLAPDQTTLNGLFVEQDLTVGNALVVERLLNEVDLNTDVYGPYNTVAPAWSTVTENEGQQLLTLTSSLTTSHWNNLATTEQDVSTTSSPTFNSLTSNNVFGFIPTAVTTYTSNDTFTWAANVKGLLVEAQAGGGGGGGSGTGTGDRGGSGGAGSYVRVFLTVVDWSTTYTGVSFVVGTGGAGGAAGTNNGSAGTNTTVNWVGGGNPLMITTFAGQGGLHGDNNRGLGGAGGAAPTVVGGYTQYPLLGAPGENGGNYGSFINNIGGRKGADAPFGRGGRGVVDTGNGTDGVYGSGGGGGGRDSDFNRPGTAGGDGFVRITTYV